LIGSLIFLAKCSRPDISFAVSKLAQFMSCFNESHWIAAKGVLRYLKGTSNMGITYHSTGNMRLTAYTDSDYAGDKVTRRSTSGMVIKLNDSIISWSSQKQPCVSLSSTEAEYIAIASAAREIVWLRSFLHELGHPQTQPTKIRVDNQSAIRLVKNPEMHTRTKHIDVRFHYIRDLANQGDIEVTYVPTAIQLADSLTKPLLKGKLETNRSQLGLQRHPSAEDDKQVKSTGRRLEEHISPMHVIHYYWSTGVILSVAVALLMTVIYLLCTRQNSAAETTFSVIAHPAPNNMVVPNKCSIISP
ncbi:unnamed protein product, partial [Allacma fusca]